MQDRYPGIGVGVVDGGIFHASGVANVVPGVTDDALAGGVSGPASLDTLSAGVTDSGGRPNGVTGFTLTADHGAISLVALGAIGIRTGH